MQHGLYLFTCEIHSFSSILKRLRPIRRAWVEGFGAWEGTFLSHVEVFLDSKLGVWEIQTEPSQAPNPAAAQARRMGRSLFNTWEGVWKSLGRDLEGLGLAQGRLGTQKWTQH